MSEEFDPLDGLSDNDKALFFGQNDERPRPKATPVAATPAQLTAQSSNQSSKIKKSDTVLILEATDCSDQDRRESIFSADWNSMKQVLSGLQNGSWIVSVHQINTTASDILGFFKKDGWPSPVDSKKDSFEVMIKDGKIFRSEPSS